MGNPEGKRPLGSSSLRWDDNIKMDLPEVGCEGMDCIDLGRDMDKWPTFVSAVMKLRVA